MKTREFELDKLFRARELQDEAAKLHIPLPVMSWEFEVKDKNGNIVEKGIGKANSFTRNALNLLAWNVGCADQALLSSSSFGDGFLSLKYTTGALSNSVYRNTSTNASYNPRIYLGTGTTESLDDYALPAYACTRSFSSSFNDVTRKLITIISGSYANTSGSEINITESAIRHISASTSYYVLTVHDVFEAITVADGETITWTYVIEVSYPNP